MSWLPFDPMKARGPDPPPERGARRERRRGGAEEAGDRSGGISVTELSEMIRGTLEAGLPGPLRVVGQVSNLSTPNHWYFSLKDESSVIGCVAWASTARRFGFTPGNGDEVVATGTVGHYAPQGRTQFYVTRLEPVGAGALEIRFRAMCRELRALGYFDAERKRPLPVFPRRIAVITSAGGAAIHDVVSTARRRCPGVGLVLVDVRVQGEGAADEIARVMRGVDRARDRLGVDAIIVTRGGGSMEDLWAFNERVVADAALACTLPIVAAIGHESDTTVIELVADHRAATPTQAAMALVPEADALRQQIAHLGHRLTTLVRRRVTEARHRTETRQRDLVRAARGRLAAERLRVERFAGQLARLRPERLLARRHERIAVLADRLVRATRARIDRRPHVDALGARLDRTVRARVVAARSRVHALEREFAAVDPRRVLRRGFSYTTNARGALIRTLADVRIGDAVVTHLAGGEFGSRVDRKSDSRPDAPAPSPPSRTSGGKTSGMDLFDSPE